MLSSDLELAVGAPGEGVDRRREWTGPPIRRLRGAAQRRKAGGVGLQFRQPVSRVEHDHAIETTPGGNQISTGFIDGGQHTKHRGFGRFVAEFDVMFRGIVEAAFGLHEVALVEEAFAQLAVSARKSFFVPDDPMVIERQGKRRHGLFPSAGAGLLEGEVVIQDAEGPVVLQCAQEIQCLKVIGAGLLGAAGADMQVAEIGQRVGDGVVIAFRPLDGEHLTVALLRAVEILHHGARVSEVAQGGREGFRISLGAVVRHGRFPGLAGMEQIAAMKKNSRPMFMIFSHWPSAFSHARWRPGA